MLTESGLSLLVIIATCAGIGLGYTTKAGVSLAGVSAWSVHYSSWTAAAGLGSKIGAFVIGAANMIGSFGLPHHLAIVIMGVFVASFAGTSLDTATRIHLVFNPDQLSIRETGRICDGLKAIELDRCMHPVLNKATGVECSRKWAVMAFFRGFTE